MIDDDDDDDDKDNWDLKLFLVRDVSKTGM